MAISILPGLLHTLRHILPPPNPLGLNGAALAVFGESPLVFASPLTDSIGLLDEEGVKLGDSTFNRFLLEPMVSTLLILQQ